MWCDTLLLAADASDKPELDFFQQRLSWVELLLLLTQQHPRHIDNVFSTQLTPNSAELYQQDKIYSQSQQGTYDWLIRLCPCFHIRTLIRSRANYVCYLLILFSCVAVASRHLVPVLSCHWLHWSNRVSPTLASFLVWTNAWSCSVETHNTTCMSSTAYSRCHAADRIVLQVCVLWVRSELVSAIGQHQLISVLTNQYSLWYRRGYPESCHSLVISILLHPLFITGPPTHSEGKPVLLCSLASVVCGHRLLHSMAGLQAASPTQARPPV